MILILVIIAIVLLMFSFLPAAIFGNVSSEKSSSILIKDNVLRYEVVDAAGKKKKTSFSLTNLNKHLLKHGKLNIINNLTLSKQNPDKASSANNLLVTDINGKTISLKQLANKDIDTYNDVCMFLDMIKDFDDLQLDFRLRRYISKSNNMILAKDNIKQLKQERINCNDADINQQISLTIDKINESLDKSEEINNDDQFRRLNDYYVKMLVNIVDNYNSLDKNEDDKNKLLSTKQNVLESFNLINNAFDSLYNQEENTFDKLESEVISLEKLASDSNNLLEELKNK